MASSCASSLVPSLLLTPPNYSYSLSRHYLVNCSLSTPSPSSLALRVSVLPNWRKNRALSFTLAASASSGASSSSFDDFESQQPLRGDKKSVLGDLIHEIEPLDVSLIQKDVPPTTIDAIKRTISGMLGLLPSDRFQVFIESLWEPLSKLLISSMMTGYTLRNAEYRLCFERNFGVPNDISEDSVSDDFKRGAQPGETMEMVNGQEPELKFEDLKDDGDLNTEALGQISSEARQYIDLLQSQLSSMKRELHDLKRRSAALQMQQFVGEEKNELLDYLRSLEPEKVAELSETKYAESKEIIHSVVHGLLATLSPKLHSKAPPQSENPSAGPVTIGNEDCTEKVESSSLQFQAHISLTRDYLARLLFWCMLLGHYLRGVECRMELMGLLSLSGDFSGDSDDG